MEMIAVYCDPVSFLHERLNLGPSRDDERI